MSRDIEWVRFIAERTLAFDAPGVGIREVVVKIGKPVCDTSDPTRLGRAHSRYRVSAATASWDLRSRLLAGSACSACTRSP